jgi:hypothetical protein
MNSTKLDDVWFTRDYPMLLAIMKHVDTVGTPLQSYELEIDLDDEDQRRALRALQSQGLITASYRGDWPDGVESVSGRAYELTGLHPDGNEARERLVSVLEQLAEKTDDKEEASKIAKVAKQFGTLSRDTAAGFLSAMASGTVG